jgi:hypothetical protein
MAYEKEVNMAQNEKEMAASVNEKEHQQPLADITRLLNEDTTPWYKKPNLRFLYMFLVPAAIGVEMTSGYDGSVLNGLQAVERWNICMFIQLTGAFRKVERC